VTSCFLILSSRSSPIYFTTSGDNFGFVSSEPSWRALFSEYPAFFERQIETLKLRIRELEEINEAHKKLNGELREELTHVRKALTRIP